MAEPCSGSCSAHQQGTHVQRQRRDAAPQGRWIADRRVVRPGSGPAGSRRTGGVMNRSEAAKIVAILAAAYPAAKMQDQTVFVYQVGLSDISYAEVERAVMMLIRTATFI